MKKILLVDDSALMRRMLCDIINEDERFEVADTAVNGRKALELLKANKYDAVVLDVNMPEMTGIQLLMELRKNKIPARVMMASTDTKEGAQTTLTALELGALDFVEKPGVAGVRVESFRTKFLMTLEAVASARMPSYEAEVKPAGNPAEVRQTIVRQAAEQAPPRKPVRGTGQRIVAIASSTGGPKALQSVIPRLPGNLNAPVLLVQHMPKGFTASMAERLDGLSDISVKEAAEGEELKKGVVYISMGGMHLSVKTLPDGRSVIHYLDEPLREGVKPCANYMYESLEGARYDEVVCVVMTGMGADGTAGIRNLKNASKPVHVIAQDKETCVVYGMPKSVNEAGLADRVVPLEQIAQEIVAQIGVQ